jgi:SAM-dependent methyltransferase
LSGFKDHFSACAAGYAAYRPRYPAELPEFLASVAPRREVAWEAGCGSGQFTEGLAPHFERVIATDASAEQLARAPTHPRIEYRRARAEESGLPDRCADLVVAVQAAHWFDLPKWSAEARRVGKPDAIVSVAGYGNVYIEGEIDAVVTRFYSEDLGSYWPPERTHLEDGYRNLHFPFERIDVPHFDMVVSWTLDQFLGYVRTWSAVAALERAVGLAAYDRFRAELAEVWGRPETRRILRWPLAVLAGRL